MMIENEKRRPAFKGKLDRVEFAIWENKNREGNAFHSVSFSRTFAKPGENGEKTWLHTSTFGEKDLESLAKAIELAKDWFSGQRPEQVEVS